MPNRVVREGILTSDRVNKLSWVAENFFRRLISVVDDYGRFDGRPSIIRITAFPLKVNQVSESDIVKWSDECAAAGLIRFYEVDGKRYLELFDFDQRLRIKKSRFPAPPTDDGHMSDIRPPVGNQNPNPKIESESEGESGRARVFEKIETGYQTYSPPSLAICEEFFFRAGAARELGAKFYYHYTASGWKDGAGNEVRDWTAKAQRWIIDQKNKQNGTAKRDGRREPAPHGTPQGKL